MRSKSSKKEKTRKQAVQSLMVLGVLEPSLSQWATNHDFVRKKDGDPRQPSKFRQMI